MFFFRIAGGKVVEILGHLGSVKRPGTTRSSASRVRSDRKLSYCRGILLREHSPIEVKQADEVAYRERNAPVTAVHRARQRRTLQKSGSSCASTPRSGSA